ncbi:MAG TPA: sulfite exporter TauE/SafE family protein [Capsulimonadaceae bacterium]|nr:sulfite exporter TauE/SafE family protein [Capsulimonadaceae bacterium]
MDLRYSLTGLFVGFLVGLTGMGGGSLMTPILYLFLHTKLKIAIGSDLAYGAIMRIFGSWQHFKAKNVNVGLALRLAAGSVPASLVGVWYTKHLEAQFGPSAQHILARFLGVALMLVAVSLVLRLIPSIKKKLLNNPKLEERQKSLLWTLPIGVVLGFLVGVTSVGAGALFGASMLLLFGMGVKEMVGTDVFQATLLSAAAAAGHMIINDVNYTLVATLLIGAIPGILVGSRLATRLPDKVLQPALATVLLCVGLAVLR